MNQGKVIILNDKNFDDYIANNVGLLLVDFWAEWCNPCKLLLPIIEELSIEYDNQLVISKINVSDNPAISEKYCIQSIPTILLFKKNDIVDKKIGMLSKIELKEWISTYL
ncbi:MAG: thioredoxin [Buchnera aphidicola (Eriosoma harunire)]